MAVNIGPKIGIDGEAKYRAEINNIIQQAKTLDSEMRAVTSSFADNASALEKNTATSRVLTQQISVQEQRISKLSEMLAKSAAKYGENDTKTLKWRQAVNEATASLNKMQSELDQSSNAADDYGDAVDDAQEKTLSFGDVLKANILGDVIVGGLKAIANGFKNIAQAAVGYNATIESYQTSFEVMTGSAEKAQKVVEELTDFATKTPFEMQDLAETTQLLMNYGFTAEEAMDRMSMLGDIAQGSADKMNRIATAYGQMSSAGKVQLEDIKQMIEAGFNPLQEISQSTGESMESLYERISDGAVSVDEITASMQRSTAEGGKYFQSMEKQSETLNGQISTLKDNIDQTLGGVFEGISQTLTQTVLPQLNQALQSIDVESLAANVTAAFDGIVAAVQKMQPYFQQFADFVINNFPVIAGVIAGAGIAVLIGNITAAVLALTAAMAANPIGFIVTAIAAVVAGLAAWIATDEEVQARIKTAVEEFGAMVESVKLWMQNLDAYLDEVLGTFFNVTLPGLINTATLFVQEKFTQIGEFFSTLWEGIVEGVKSFGEGVVETAGDIVETVKKTIDDAVEFIKSLPEKAFQWGADLISGFIDGIKSIDLGEAIKGVADTITSFLHFSRPDVGPLREYESWMPDMMSGLAKGILDNQYLVTNALATVTRGMKNSFSPALAVSGGSGTVVHIESVSFTNYTPDQGAALVDDLNRQLGRLL